ncbi:hypothetical protein LTR85_009722 [Meristemomyces frigidus]|nr:hypothetical protein LTR85_009722 [Meristemomyces frigidus]
MSPNLAKYPIVVLNVQAASIPAAIVPPQNAEQATSRLQSLPGELRNRIYRLVPAVSTTNKGELKVLLPGLAATYHSISNEFLDIYYGERSFLFYAPKDRGAPEKAIKTWVASLGPNVDKADSVAAWLFIAAGRDGVQQAIITATISKSTLVTFTLNDVLNHLCTYALKNERGLFMQWSKRSDLLENAAKICSTRLYAHYKGLAARKEAFLRPCRRCGSLK